MTSSLNSFSSASVDKINYRQKGKSSEGRLARGFIKNASSKVSVGSIPSKFETIVYKNSNSKAFDSSQLRFTSTENEKPDPGYYEEPTQSSIAFGEKESLSKKGYGNGFVSTCERTTFSAKYLKSGPGPGTYSNETSVMTRASSTASLKGSSMFLAKPRNQKEIENKNKVIVETPGPGEYNPKLLKSANAYHSSFISRSNREKYLNANTNPAPDDGQKKLLVGTSQPIPEIETTAPGPTSYDPKISEFRPEYLNSQATSNFKEGVKDRFGDLNDHSREKKPFPGPEAYRREDYGFTKAGQEKALVSGSAFMSETARKPYGEFENRLGPTRSIPYIQPLKKSFHLNLARKFL